MFGGGSSPPPAPVAPARDDAAIAARAAQEAAINRQKRGRAGLILTGGLGDSEFGQNIRGATLLGQSSIAP